MKKAKKTIRSLLIACLAYSFMLGTFSFSPEPVFAESREREQRDTDQPYVEGEVLVKYKKESINLETSYGKMAAAFHGIQKAAVKIDDIQDGNIAVLEIKDGSSVEQKVAELRRDSRVEYAEPNYRREPTVINTNDAHRELLWGLDNTGQSINGSKGTVDADMDVPEAWAINEGTQGEVVVAVIDTGVAYTHEDLAQNMWNGSQCVDESGKSLGGCIHGYDFEFNDKNPDPSDNTFAYARFHGTHVAGTIAAVKNNSVGIIGVAPRAKIMALKSALDSDELVRAVDFARHNGAKVINASYGGSLFSQAEYDAIKRFGAAGGIFVAAAGNDGTDNDGDPHYPSNYDLDAIIAIAATNKNNALASFSQYGKVSVDVGAPGVEIYSAMLPQTATKELQEKTPRESFEGAIAPASPVGWTLTGNWGTKQSGGTQGVVLHADLAAPPYAENGTGTIATAPAQDVSGLSGVGLVFTSQCDTEQAQGYDYLQLEYSTNGTTFTPVYKWSESTLKSLPGAEINNGAVKATVAVPIGGAYISPTLTYRFRWVVVDDLFNDFGGCFVDDIRISQIQQSTIDTYAFLQGTSMATPHVTGLAALLKGYKPNLTVAQMKVAILLTGDSLPALEGKTVSGKRVNARSALLSLTPAIAGLSVVLNNETVNATIVDEAITLGVPFGANVTALAPVITFTGTSVSPASGVSQDFTQPVTYTVTAADGSVKTYTVTVTVLGSPSLTVSVGALSPKSYQAAAGTAPEQGALTVRIETSEVEDMLLDDITFSTTANAHDAAVASTTLYRANSAAGPWVQAGESIVFNPNEAKPGFARWQFSGSNRIALTKGTATFLKLVPLYAPVAQKISGLQPQFALTALHGIGAGSVTELTPDVSVVIGNPITVLNATLSLALSPSSPSGQMVGGQGVELLRFDAAATGQGTATIERIDLSFEKTAATITNLALYPFGFDKNADYRATCAPLSETRWRCIPSANNNTNQISAGAPSTYIVRGDIGFSPIGTISVALDVNNVVWNDGAYKQTIMTQAQTTLSGALFSSGASGPFDTTRPTISSLTFTDTDSHAKVGAGDTITIAFSEPIDPLDIASGLVPGGSAIVIADGATGDVSLAKTTGILTIKDIATIDLDTGQTKEDTTYIVSVVLDVSGKILKLTLTEKTSGSGVLTGAKQSSSVTSVETRVSDANGNLLASSEVQSTVLPAQSAKKITSFSLAGTTGTIDQQNHTIALTVPFGTNVKALSPTIDILASSVSPESGVAQNFTEPVMYTVKALDGTTQLYTASVAITASAEKTMTGFSFLLAGKEYTGIIDQSARTVSVIVPNGTNVTSLSPTITINGATVSPASGVLRDFSTPTTYTVTAQDGSTRTYTVTVTVAEKATITTFTVTALGIGGATVAGIIDENAKTITITFPLGTDVSNLTSAITFTGLSIVPSVGSTTFKPQQTYTVTALDRSEQAYAVLMSVTKNSAKQITAFSFQNPQAIGIINQEKKVIVLTVPAGTNVTALSPTVVMTGASVSLASGIAQNFTNPVVYTVTAEDGTTATYTVIVKVLANTEIIPDDAGAVSVTKEKPKAIVISTEKAVSMKVDADVSNATIDFGALINDGKGSLPKTTIETNKAVVEIPGTTTVESSDTTWDGVMKAPTPTQDVSLPAIAGQTLSLSAAVDVGSSTSALSFNKGVRLVLVGKAGKRAGYQQAGGAFTEIAAVCAADDQATGDALSSNGECKIDVGAELVIWTKHFTTFAAYTQTQIETGGGSSGGGGGGSSGGGGGGSFTPPITHPTPPPGGFRIVINNGDPMTSSQNVVLNLTAGSDTAFMKVGQTADLKNVSKEPYASKKIWTLLDEIGAQTVYVQFFHTDGSASSVVSDSILYLKLIEPREERRSIAPPVPFRQPLQSVTAPQQVLGVKISRGSDSPRKEPGALAKRLSGRILLQVQERGEGWYVYPDTKIRYYLGRPNDAFDIMRTLGLGVKHELIATTISYPERLRGKILLDVEMHGEAYYINPTDARAYYLGRPADAFRIMRELGLGITNDNLNMIEVASLER